MEIISKSWFQKSNYHNSSCRYVFVSEHTQKKVIGRQTGDKPRSKGAFQTKLFYVSMIPKSTNVLCQINNTKGHAGNKYTSNQQGLKSNDQELLFCAKISQYPHYVMLNNHIFSTPDNFRCHYHYKKTPACILRLRIYTCSQNFHKWEQSS